MFSVIATEARSHRSHVPKNIKTRSQEATKPRSHEATGATRSHQEPGATRSQDPLGARSHRNHQEPPGASTTKNKISKKKTVWGCMSPTYRSYGLCWTRFGAVWQPTCLMGSVGQGLGLYGNLHVLWALLDRGCMLATYRSYGLCWTRFGAVCRQPTSLVGSVGPGLGLCGNLHVLWALLDRVWGCMATYMSYVLCWTGFGAVCWQPTSVMRLPRMPKIGTVCGAVPTDRTGSVGPGCFKLLYVGNLGSVGGPHGCLKLGPGL